MGILKRLGRALSNMANAPANLLGKGIEKLGEVTNIWPVEKFGMKIQEVFPIEPLEYETANTKEIIDIHKEAQKARDEMLKKCQKRVDNELRKRQDVLDEWCDDLGEYFALDDMQTIEFELYKEETKQSIIDTLSYTITQKLSGDNPDFVTCLNGDEKKKSDFLDELEEEINEQLRHTVTVEHLKVQRNVLIEINRYYSTVYQLLERQKEYQTKLQEARDNKVAKDRLKATYTLQQAYLLCMQTLLWQN